MEIKKLKQIVLITYTSEKTYFAIATFEDLWVVSCQTEPKTFATLVSASLLWFFQSIGD